MEDQRTCKDCFNCKTKITFKINRGNKYTGSRIGLPKNPKMEYLLNKIIVFGSVRCTKGMWQMTKKKEEKVYKSFKGFMDGNIKLTDAERCPEFDGERY